MWGDAPFTFVPYSTSSLAVTARPTRGKVTLEEHALYSCTLAARSLFKVQTEASIDK
jgi:hypothetical protein